MSSDPRAPSEKMATDLGLTLPLLSDAELKVIRAYGVEHVGKRIALPATFVIGRDGRVLYRYIGGTPWDRPTAEKVIEVLERLRRG